MTATPVEDLRPAPPVVLINPELPVATVRDLVAPTGHPERPRWTPDQLRALTCATRETLAVPLGGILRYERQQRWWARLALTDEVELWLLSWLPGQETRPHDHNGASGSFSVLLGEVREDYRYPGQPVRRRTHAAGAGLGFGPERAHQVRNVSTAPAATVHAYSPPLLPTREYADLREAHR